MSPASSLAVAADYLFQAVTGLDGAVRVLDRVDARAASGKARGLHDDVAALQKEIRHAAVTAHKAERPEVYDESGRWVGRHGKGQS